MWSGFGYDVYEQYNALSNLALLLAGSAAGQMETKIQPLMPEHRLESPKGAMEWNDDFDFSDTTDQHYLQLYRKLRSVAKDKKFRLSNGKILGTIRNQVTNLFEERILIPSDKCAEVVAHVIESEGIRLFKDAMDHLRSIYMSNRLTPTIRDYINNTKEVRNPAQPRNTRGRGSWRGGRGYNHNNNVYPDDYDESFETNSPGRFERNSPVSFESHFERNSSPARFKSPLVQGRARWDYNDPADRRSGDRWNEGRGRGRGRGASVQRSIVPVKRVLLKTPPQPLIGTQKSPRNSTPQSTRVPHVPQTSASHAKSTNTAAKPSGPSPKSGSQTSSGGETSQPSSSRTESATTPNKPANTAAKPLGTWPKSSFQTSSGGETSQTSSSHTESAATPNKAANTASKPLGTSPKSGSQMSSVNETSQTSQTAKTEGTNLQVSPSAPKPTTPAVKPECFAAQRSETSSKTSFEKSSPPQTSLSVPKPAKTPVKSSDTSPKNSQPEKISNDSILQPSSSKPESTNNTPAKPSDTSPKICPGKSSEDSKFSIDRVGVPVEKDIKSKSPVLQSAASATGNKMPEMKIPPSSVQPSKKDTVNLSGCVPKEIPLGLSAKSSQSAESVDRKTSESASVAKTSATSPGTEGVTSTSATQGNSLSAVPTKHLTESTKVPSKPAPEISQKQDSSVCTPQSSTKNDTGEAKNSESGSSKVAEGTFAKEEHANPAKSFKIKVESLTGSINEVALSFSDSEVPKNYQVPSVSSESPKNNQVSSVSSESPSTKVLIPNKIAREGTVNKGSFARKEIPLNILAKTSEAEVPLAVKSQLPVKSAFREPKFRPKSKPELVKFIVIHSTWGNGCKSNAIRNKKDPLRATIQLSMDSKKCEDTAEKLLQTLADCNLQKFIRNWTVVDFYKGSLTTTALFEINHDSFFFLKNRGFQLMYVKSNDNNDDIEIIEEVIQTPIYGHKITMKFTTDVLHSLTAKEILLNILEIKSLASVITTSWKIVSFHKRAVGESKKFETRITLIVNDKALNTLQRLKMQALVKIGQQKIQANFSVIEDATPVNRVKVWCYSVGLYPKYTNLTDKEFIGYLRRSIKDLDTKAWKVISFFKGSIRLALTVDVDEKTLKYMKMVQESICEFGCDKYRVYFCMDSNLNLNNGTRVEPKISPSEQNIKASSSTPSSSSTGNANASAASSKPDITSMNKNKSINANSASTQDLPTVTQTVSVIPTVPDNTKFSVTSPVIKNQQSSSEGTAAKNNGPSSSEQSNTGESSTVQPDVSSPSVKNPKSSTTATKEEKLSPRDPSKATDSSTIQPYVMNQKCSTSEVVLSSTTIKNEREQISPVDPSQIQPSTLQPVASSQIKMQSFCPSPNSVKTEKKSSSNDVPIKTESAVSLSSPSALTVSSPNRTNPTTGMPEPSVTYHSDRSTMELSSINLATSSEKVPASSKPDTTPEYSSEKNLSVISSMFQKSSALSKTQSSNSTSDTKNKSFTTSNTPESSTDQGSSPITAVSNIQPDKGSQNNTKISANAIKTDSGSTSSTSVISSIATKPQPAVSKPETTAPTSSNQINDASQLNEWNTPRGSQPGTTSAVPNQPSPVCEKNSVPTKTQAISHANNSKTGGTPSNQKVASQTNPVTTAGGASQPGTTSTVSNQPSPVCKKSAASQASSTASELVVITVDFLPDKHISPVDILRGIGAANPTVTQESMSDWVFLEFRRVLRKILVLTIVKRTAVSFINSNNMRCLCNIDKRTYVATFQFSTKMNFITMAEKFAKPLIGNILVSCMVEKTHFDKAGHKSAANFAWDVLKDLGVRWKEMQLSNTRIVNARQEGQKILFSAHFNSGAVHCIEERNGCFPFQLGSHSFSGYFFDVQPVPQEKKQRISLMVDPSDFDTTQDDNDRIAEQIIEAFRNTNKQLTGSNWAVVDCYHIKYLFLLILDVDEKTAQFVKKQEEIQYQGKGKKSVMLCAAHPEGWSDYKTKWPMYSNDVFNRKKIREYGTAENVSGSLLVAIASNGRSLTPAQIDSIRRFLLRKSQSLPKIGFAFVQETAFLLVRCLNGPSRQWLIDRMAALKTLAGMDISYKEHFDCSVCVWFKTSQHSKSLGPEHLVWELQEWNPRLSSGRCTINFERSADDEFVKRLLIKANRDAIAGLIDINFLGKIFDEKAYFRILGLY